MSDSNDSVPRLISLNKFLEDMGVTSTTGWRWRKRGILQTVNIYGRLYVSAEVIEQFHQRATAGEFAKEVSPQKAEQSAADKKRAGRKVPAVDRS